MNIFKRLFYPEYSLAADILLEGGLTTDTGIRRPIVREMLKNASDETFDDIVELVNKEKKNRS